MKSLQLTVAALSALGLGLSTGQGQIDSTRRELIEGGYNASFKGNPPLSGYGFYYRNQPDFLGSNVTLRLVVAPTYLDSELGLAGALGANTDLGIGISGGGYRDSYDELRQGKYLRDESFDGYRGQMSLGVYHLFNPGYKVPLYGVVQGAGRFVYYSPTSRTASDFVVPDHRSIYSVRAGLRWGGRPPVLFPDKAMELSAWYEGLYRTDAQIYGFGDRRVEPHTQLFWGNAYLAYHLTKWKHPFSVNLTGGTSIDADRFSAYRLGGVLPMAAEFPLSLPGYYWQELSARRFAQAGATYAIPLTANRRWNIQAMAATAYVDYLPGLEQPRHWNSGAGGGVLYNSKAWRVLLNYGYGFDAIRSGERGAHAVGILLQLDLDAARKAYHRAEPPGLWHGLQKVLGS